MTPIDPDHDAVRATLAEIARHRASILARFIPELAPEPEPEQPATGNLLPITQPPAVGVVTTDAHGPVIYEPWTVMARLFRPEQVAE